MDKYFNLMNTHSETELFKEIIHFMNMSFPDWRTNRGIGFTAVEFVSHSIEFLSLCNLEKKDDELTRESFKTLYLSLAEDYDRFKNEYQSIFSSFVLEKFHIEYEDELEDEYLTDVRYNYLYDDFLNKELDKNPFNFTDVIL